MTIRKAIMALIVLMLLVSILAAGCGSQTGAQNKSEPTANMAWQFAQGLVKSRVPNPSNATFPRYETSFIERKGQTTFVISSYVNTLNSEGTMISYNFIIEAEYVGNDVFQETAVELRKE